jgi:hypothetical protein
MLFAFFTSRDGKTVIGIVLATLSWLWQVKLIQGIFLVIGVWSVERSVQSWIDERDRIAKERHEQILKALDQIADKLGHRDK